MIAIDTNLLIYAHRAGTAQHDAAQQALRQAMVHADGWGITLPTLTEFWSVVTHPAAAGGPSTPTEASDFIRGILDQGEGELWTPRPDLWRRLVQAATDLGVAGPRIFDLHIAMVAIDNGADQIWTNDRHFLAVPGLRVVQAIG